MSQGSIVVFDAWNDYLRDGDIDLEGGTWAAVLLSDPITALLRNETNPALGSTNMNEVAAAGGYSANGIALTLDNAIVAGVLTMKLNTTTHSGGAISWTAQAGSPTNIKTLGIVDLAATSPIDAAVCFFDMTADGGTTPISLVAGNIGFTFGTGGTPGDILTSTVQ